MKITTIKASAGRTIPHPHESYSNLKFHVELTAELKAGEDAGTAALQLQNEVDSLLKTNCDQRMAALQSEYEEARRKREEEYAKQAAITKAAQAVREAERRLKCLQAGEDPDDEDYPF